MPGDFATRLRALARVVVRVGLNLQPGQRLLIAEPYELQGVARSAEVIVEAVREAAGAAGAAGVAVIWGDGARLREFVLNKDRRGFVQLAGDNARQMHAFIRNGDALLFLQGSQPRLFDGLPAGDVGDFQRLTWEAFGPVAQRLMAAETNWAAVPTPSPAWAHVAYADLPSVRRLEALWERVFSSCRVDAADPEKAWHSHLETLGARCDRLNSNPVRRLHYRGPGTDLTVELPAGHRWRTAQLRTAAGVAFVANLPTEEIFTLPDRASAEGRLHVARTVVYANQTIEGIDLEFHRGRVASARARSNPGLLEELLATDDGAAHLGEVALVNAPALSASEATRLLHHPLLDENALNHVALGESYAFCLDGTDRRAANRSLIHVDLPVDATIECS
ncbi:MAG TPA: aminopeptidase [Lacunisphaera sp.]|jgi:aminopeptidase|nr:aminopeptidase [Lacunisphaera sp.]